MNTKNLSKLILVFGLGLGGAVQAEGLLDKVGKGVANVTKQVGETIDSTVDLVSEDGTPAEIRAEVDAMAASSLQRLFEEKPAASDPQDPISFGFDPIWGERGSSILAAQSTERREKRWFMDAGPTVSPGLIPAPSQIQVAKLTRHA